MFNVKNISILSHIMSSVLLTHTVYKNKYTFEKEKKFSSRKICMALQKTIRIIFLLYICVSII
jgi:hypothetical protein